MAGLVPTMPLRSASCELNFLHPELVHPRKSIWEFGFKCVPVVEVVHRPPRGGEPAPILLQGVLAEFKAKKFEPVFGDDRFDGGNIHARLLHMKQQVAALARAEKIGKARDTGQRRPEKLLPASADIGWR